MDVQATSKVDSPPLIGLPGRRVTARDIAGFPPALGHLDTDMYLADFGREVLAAGGLPLHLPLDGDPAAYVPHLDGIVLTGGSDIEPWRYGAEPDGRGAYEPERDQLELALLEAALAADLAVLGVCRGLQVVNVHAGGSLHQDVPAHARFDVSPAGAVHDVVFDRPSRLHQLYGHRAEVNSLHHQTVDRVGRGLVVTGRAGDGTIEALEMPDRAVIAVQWHPEMSATPEPVFDWLVTEARQKAATAVR
jgi:putative glutamine amidotransferase